MAAIIPVGATPLTQSLTRATAGTGTGTLLTVTALKTAKIVGFKAHVFNNSGGSRNIKFRVKVNGNIVHEKQYLSMSPGANSINNAEEVLDIILKGGDTFQAEINLDNSLDYANMHLQAYEYTP